MSKIYCAGRVARGIDWRDSLKPFWQTHTYMGPDLTSLSTTGPILHRMCLDALVRSEIIFTWLDSEQAYGTLVEIGFAHAKKKRIWIAGPAYYDECWFAYECATLRLIDPAMTPFSALDYLLGIHEHTNGTNDPKGP